MQEMQRAINHLEKSVLTERKNHNRLIDQLRNEKIQLHKDLDKMKNNERLLKLRVQELMDKQLCAIKTYHQIAITAQIFFFCFRNSAETFKTMYRRRRSPLIKKHEETRNVRMRSISPRATKSEGWASDEKSYYER